MLSLTRQSILASGTATFELLTLPASAKAAAMGDAYSAYADEGTTLFYNPAGLGNVYFDQVGYVRTEFADQATDTGGLATPPAYQQIFYVLPANYGSFGFGYRSLSAGDIKVVDDEFQTTTITAGDTAITGGYGLAIGDLNLGVNVHYLDSTLGEFTARTFAVDAGMLFYFDFPSFFRRRNNNFTISAALLNVGPGLQFGETIEPIPFNYRFGLGYSIFTNRLFEVSFFGESAFYQDQFDKFSFGMELMVFEYIFLRGGTTIVSHSIDSSETNFTAGAGIRLPMYERRITFNYAFLPRDGEVFHQFGGHFTLGGAPKGLPWLDFFRAKATAEDALRRKLVYLTEAEKAQLTKLDARILLLLRSQIYEFYLSEGRFPRDLNELLLYLNDKQIYDIPNPKDGRYLYSKRSGQILIK